MLDVLYDDRAVVVVDKPAGMATVPSRGGGPSVANETGLLVCHRLDACTSGCLVLARTAEAQRRLNADFAEGRVAKVYAAVCRGDIPDEGACDTPLGAWHRGRVAVGRGRPAWTTWRVRWRRDGLVGVEARPRTGRTHQVRAHLMVAGAPILGDDTYGGRPWNRVMLHAWRVELPGPIRVEAPLPEGFA